MDTLGPLTRQRILDLLDTADRQLADGSFAAALDTCRTALAELPPDAGEAVRGAIENRMAAALAGERAPRAGAALPTETQEPPASAVPDAPPQPSMSAPSSFAAETPRFGSFAAGRIANERERRRRMAAVAFLAAVIGAVVAIVSRPHPPRPAHLSAPSSEPAASAPSPAPPAVRPAPRASGGDDTLYYTTNGVVMPRLLSKVEPQYTAEARAAHYEGTVVLSAQIEPTGRVGEMMVLHGLEYGLNERAMQAVRQWRFEPARKDGRPVAIRAQIEVNFRLR